MDKLNSGMIKKCKLNMDKLNEMNIKCDGMEIELSSAQKKIEKLNKQMKIHRKKKLKDLKIRIKKVERFKKELKLLNKNENNNINNN